MMNNKYNFQVLSKKISGVITRKIHVNLIIFVKMLRFAEFRHF